MKQKTLREIWCFQCREGKTGAKMIKKQIGESFVFDKQEWMPSRYKQLLSRSLRLYRQNTNDFSELNYIEGKDYEADYLNGMIRRMPDSTIPDFRCSAFYGKKPFDQMKEQNWGNAEFLIYADYEYNSDNNKDIERIAEDISIKNGNRGSLSNFLSSYKNKNLKYMVWGDSISTGCEAFPKNNTYFYRFKNYIEEKYNCNIEIINTAVGGDSTAEGRNRFYENVLNKDFDLISIGFGMNDQNCFGDLCPVTTEIFETNIFFFINELKKRNKEIILISPCQPHPNWIHTSGKLNFYTEILRKLSDEYNVAYADVYKLWQSELDFGKSADSLLRNGINHPNNYGHYIYSIMLKQLI